MMFRGMMVCVNDTFGSPREAYGLLLALCDCCGRPFTTGLTPLKPSRLLLCPNNHWTMPGANCAWCGKPLEGGSDVKKS
jgi:hypothetical protein